MTIRLYSTLTRRKDLFLPMHGGKVNLFVCGPTVYDYPHLGHAKTYTQFDLIARYLRQKGLDVFYLQNFTDIDDKIINRAKEKNIPPSELARNFENVYLEDMHALHNTSVTKYARATEHIPQIVRQVKTLMEKGFAYRTSDGYYFDLKRFAPYGKLSGRTELRENDAVSRIDENDEKRNSGDFCLWKFEKPDEPAGDTEIGRGRPGWHIEDTAITEQFFGPQYDIHGGAVDLIFPHHEAEIAQMEAASGKEPLVRYWLHTGFLNIDSEKMSKSQGNFTTIRDALARYDYKVLRYFFLSQHYRTTIDYSDSSLEQSKNALQRLNDFVFSIDRNLDDAGAAAAVERCKTEIYAALDDDIDTPKALAVLYDFIRERNTVGGNGERVLALMRELNELFDCITLETGAVEEDILALARERDEARGRKDWAKSDALRAQIQARGYIVEDAKTGTKVRKA